jgi:hypothetical protein
MSRRRRLAQSSNWQLRRSQAGELVRADLDLLRPPVSADIDLLLPAIAHGMRQRRSPLVYTAFDGDHLALIPHMRAFVLAKGCVPANPESILGYKQVVDARKTKELVLVDDLAILKQCDELWVFTSVEPTLGAVSQLAEGVLVELLFFLKRSPGRGRIKFVPIELLLGSETAIAPRAYRASFAETVRALGQDQRSVVDLVDRVRRGTGQLPEIVYVAHDPLDVKYSQWVRAHLFDEGRIPLVPYLAVELRDGSLMNAITHRSSNPDLASLGSIVECWIRLMRLAKDFWVLDRVDLGQRRSYVVQLMEHAWSATGAKARPVVKADWDDFDVPKVEHGQNWPLTERESLLR